jgi:DNA-binding transcriptional ArsR family regulator
MVRFYEPTLDRTFAALADPTRRALLAQLDERPNLSVSELARPFPVTLPAVMKHLDVLSEAGLITRVKTGRTVTCRLNAAPMREAVTWLSRYQRFWSAQLDRLIAFVEDDTCSAQGQATPQLSPQISPQASRPISSRASSSSAASARPRRRSTPLGRSRSS